MEQEMVRVSLGTAILLDLKEGNLKVKPTTAYIMVGENCQNNCSFCTQARDSTSKADLLGRVTWPEYQFKDVLEALKDAEKDDLRRICLQCLNDPIHLTGLPSMVQRLHDASELPISVSIGPLGVDRSNDLKRSGADRVGIALDGASPAIFDAIKGKDVGNPHTWGSTWRALDDAVSVFGKDNVSTHIIVGMGETDRDVFDTMVKARDTGITVSLFSYTPMKGTSFSGEPPSIERYRALQLMRCSIMGSGSTEGFEFSASGKLISIDIDRIMLEGSSKDAFRTRGCPDCNRPYYNERPRGPMYNYPYSVEDEERKKGIEEAVRYIDGPTSTL